MARHLQHGHQDQLFYLGVGVSSFTDKDSNTDKTDGPLTPDTQLPDPARRRFSRSAIVGSAVVLSLGNRAAWGNSQLVGCMSLATIQSFNPTGGPTGGGAFVSAPNGRSQHNPELAKQIHETGGGNAGFIGGSTGEKADKGDFATKADPNSDGVCLFVKT